MLKRLFNNKRKDKKVNRHETDFVRFNLSVL